MMSVPASPDSLAARPLMRPVRWAGGLMLVSGLLVGLLSGGYLVYALFSRAAIEQQLTAQLSAAGTESPIEMSVFINLLLLLCALGVFEGLVCAGLGWLAYRGSRAAVITSISITVLRGVIIALCGLLMAIAIFLPGFVIDSAFAWSVVTLGIFAVYLIVQLVLLILAARNLGRLRMLAAGGYGPRSQ